VKIDGINYTVIGVLEAKGAAAGGDQDNFAVIPLTTGLNRYGRWYRSVAILVQARGRESYDATVEEVRGALRVIRKTEPGKDDDFELKDAETSRVQPRKIFGNSRTSPPVQSSRKNAEPVCRVAKHFRAAPRPAPC
jgi:putative ABC transport system permease protein